AGARNRHSRVADLICCVSPRLSAAAASARNGHCKEQASRPAGLSGSLAAGEATSDGTGNRKRLPEFCRPPRRAEGGVPIQAGGTHDARVRARAGTACLAARPSIIVRRCVGSARASGGTDAKWPEPCRVLGVLKSRSAAADRSRSAAVRIALRERAARSGKNQRTIDQLMGKLVDQI